MGTPPELVIPGSEASQSGAQVKARHLGVPGGRPSGTRRGVVFYGRFPLLTARWVASERGGVSSENARGHWES